MPSAPSSSAPARTDRGGPILHVDMDAFFAAVEVRANPRLQGKPLLVGGGPDGREVVTTASYPARTYGIRSGMSLAEARARCPEAVFLPVHPERYLHASECLLRLFERVTPAVEPASIDEVFLDLAGTPGLHDGGLSVATALQDTVRREERLSCSIGIGPNKLQAKMATGLRKPGGITRLDPGDFERLFWSRSPSALWGVGPESEAALRQLGIATIGQLARTEVGRLEPVFGASARVLVRMARGQGGGRVVPWSTDTPVRSMGHQMTFPRDESDRERLRRHLLLLADRVARRLRRDGWSGYVVVLHLVFADGLRISRQRALAEAVDDEHRLFHEAGRLLDEVRENRSVRLLGISAAHLVRCGTSYPLFPEDQRRRDFQRALDRVRNRFGERFLLPGGVLALLQDDDA